MKIIGLTKQEVEKRINDGKVNYNTDKLSKSIGKILFENIFTLFNFINIILGILIISVSSYKNLLFLGVVICNTLISTVQEIKAKITLDKLSIISSKKVSVIRDGKNKLIDIDKIVLDDILIYELGDQIITDCLVVDGFCEVNESFITGESESIYKKTGDTILSGSFLVSGKVFVKVIHVGLDNYTNVISKDAKLIKKENKSLIMRFLNKLVKYISILLIPIGLLLLYNQLNIVNNTYETAIVGVVAALIGMIPEGLILLVSTVLAVSVLKLSKEEVLTQDLYSIETLARVDTICIDKTGTLTSANMVISDIVSLNNTKYSKIEEVLSIISTNLNDNNATFKAINKKFLNESKIKTKNIIPFSSQRKYSGVILDDCIYLIGAADIILKEEYVKYKEKIEKLQNNNRVVILVKLTGNKKDILENKKDALALILLKDEIRNNVDATIDFFKKNDVEIKIISGDNSSCVRKVANDVGINIKGIYDFNHSKHNEDFNKIANENNLFVRTHPDEKRLLIKALKENGHVVCMIGDGVNDVLALKEANCAISLGNASSAARSVSDFVLLNSDFNSIPMIVKEGRKTINNIERSATLFLSKTIYATLLALLFLFIKHKYPFIPIQMTLINTLTIGVPAFVLTLEPNYNRIKHNFILNVLKKAIPSGITTCLNILILIISSKIFKIDFIQMSTISVIITFYTGILLIYKISKPLNKLKRTLIVSIMLIFLIILITSIGNNIFSLNLLNTKSMLILVLLILISTKFFKLLSKITNKIMNKKKYLFD